MPASPPLLLLLGALVGCVSLFGSASSADEEAADDDDTRDGDGLPFADTDDPDTGLPIGDYFPQDGRRAAEYAQEGVDWILQLEEVGERAVDGGTAAEWEWRRGRDGDRLGGLLLASSSEGVAIHEWQWGTDASVVPDPPIALSAPDGRLRLGEPVVTASDAGTFTVTYTGRQDCPVVWGLDWQACVRLTIDDGDGDDATGAFFAGEYWLVQRYGPAWMLLTGDDAIWNLSRYEWESAG